MLSTTHKHRITTTALCSVVLAAAAVAPPAMAMPQDLRSPDTREAAVQDLRSPDTRDAAVGTSSLAGTNAGAPQDLRSPDTRDVASGYGPAPVPEPTPVESSPSGGFDWVSAAIGVAIAGGVLVLLIALLGSHGIVTRRRMAGA